jgi:hypothetical protein
MGRKDEEVAGYRERRFGFKPAYLIGPFAVLAGLIVLGGAVCDAALYRHDSYWQLVDHSLKPVPGVVLLLACAYWVLAVWGRAGVFRIGREGIETSNWWTQAVRVRWGDVGGTKRISIFPGVAILVLQHGRGVLSAGLIPEFLSEPEAFAQAVMEYAGPDHPLATVF